ncbi:MAG: class I SAM-dependent methyltransferase, partial [Clostridia bacterium]|nr:class I SAM-dependent methyltransferase [Clostridia bacterium]
MQNGKIPWNHNYAYNSWIAEKIGDRKRILDVGCGNGTLALYLRTDDNYVLGIDPSTLAIQKAYETNIYSNVEFAKTDFESFEADGEKFDAIIFVASLHHMDMDAALAKAKKLLEKGGILIIVGLAKPSNVVDWAVEAARVIPSRIVSAIKKNMTSEELHIDVSYELPTMGEVRRLCNEYL